MGEYSKLDIGIRRQLGKCDKIIYVILSRNYVVKGAKYS